jgi:CheY-like chemotaxis protein
MIIGLVGLMVEAPTVYAEELPADLRKDLEIVHRNCEHLHNMVNDVLDLSRVEAGRLVLRQEQVNLAEIIDGALATVEPLIAKKGLHLSVSVPNDLPTLYCDRLRIRQVILNLVSNATRFTTQGAVSVGVERRDGAVVISVADTGPGIPAQDAERIFEPFFQARGNSPLDQGGSGLGLTISKQCVELHGGRIWVESQPGAGTTFFVQLPISPSSGPTAHATRWLDENWTWREDAFKGARAAVNEMLTKPRIVVCDSTESLYADLAHMCDEIEFVRTRNLAEVAHALAPCPAHAILLNITGPDDAWAVLEAARKLAPDTPILICQISPPIERATQCGALTHVMKPVTRNDLQRAMRLTGQPVKRVLVVDDDPEVRELLARTLSFCEGVLEVRTAATGWQALQEIRANPPDLVLLDVVLPQMNGWEVLQRLSEDERTRDVPVVVVSGQDSVEGVATSRFMLAALGEGIPISKLLRCSIQVSGLLLGA